MKVLLLLLFFVTASFAADQIILLDSSVEQGTIVNQSDHSVTITTETVPGSGIYTDKEIPRAEIREIKSRDDEAEAFSRLKALELPETSDNTAPYDELVQDKIAPFLDRYPEGRFTTEVTKLRDRVLAERGRIAGGEVKIAGAWMAREKAEMDPEAQSQLALSNMRLAGSAIESMAAFEILEKKYASSSYFPTAVELAKHKLAEISAEISRAKVNLDRKLREREQGLQLASADSRHIIERGIIEEDNAVKAAVERARQTGQRWLPLLPDAKLLDQLSKLADSEETRLAKIDTAKLSGAVEAGRTARQQLDAGDLEGAKASLEEATELWPRYGLLASLKESLRKAQEEAARRAKEEENPSAS